jgi:pimeloyl-ACP methyl ester carboxylesterase
MQQHARIEDEVPEIWVAGPVGRIRVLDTGQPGLAAPKSSAEAQEAVLFVHGFTADASFWSEQLVHVSSRRRRALALDMRGHGRSEPPANADYRVPSLAADIAAVADEIALRRFVLVGHSFGAAVAGEYAGTHPERVSALVLVDPAGDNPRLPAAFIGPYRAALATDGYRKAVAQFVTGQLESARPEVRARVLGRLEQAPRDLVVNTTVAGLDYSVLSALARYCEEGGRAMTITADQNQGPLTVHALMPDLPRRHVPGTSHYIPLDRPAEINRLIDEALAGDIWGS